MFGDDEIWKLATICIVVFLLILSITTIFNCLKAGVCKSTASLDGKTVIITGCTAGIGRSTALDIADRGARVIMACRNLQKANKVRDSIIEATNNPNVVVKLLDVSLLSSVREFAEDINRTEHRLDVLIHNAGVILSREKCTKEGINVIWATNYFGPFLLTHLLLDLLKRTQTSRIVIVSSVIHKLSRLKVNKIKGEWDNKSDFGNYRDTKLALILFTNQLALQLKGTGVTANSLHPGTVRTSIMSLYENTIWQKFLFLCFYLFLKNPMQGAQTTIYLAVSEEVDGVTGKYFSDCKEANPSRKTKDLELAAYLWNMSKEVVGLNTSPVKTINQDQDSIQLLF